MRSKIELTCREAGLILKHIPLDKPYGEYTAEEKAAISHPMTYDDFLQRDNCECKDRGFLGIIRSLPHIDVLETWARNPGALYFNAETLREIIAVEHVWGRWVPVIDKKGTLQRYSTNVDGCEDEVCSALRNYWIQTRMSLFYDGGKEMAEEIPFLIRTFIENKLPIENLLNIQGERMNRVLEAIAEGDVRDVGSRHYNSKEEAVYELEKHMEILQELVRGK